MHVLEKKDKYIYNVLGSQISRADSSQFISLRVSWIRIYGFFPNLLEKNFFK